MLSDIKKAEYKFSLAEKDYIDASNAIFVKQNWLKVSNDRGVKVASDLGMYIQSRILTEKLLCDTKAIVSNKNSENKNTKFRIASYISNYKVSMASKKVSKLEKTLCEVVDMIAITELVLERCRKRIELNKNDLAMAILKKDGKYRTMIQTRNTLAMEKVNDRQILTLFNLSRIYM